MKPMGRRLWLNLSALSLSLAMPVLWAGVGPVLRGLKTMPSEPIGVALFMVAVGWTFNAARLRLLATSVGVALSPKTAYALVVSTEFAGAATPGGVGGPLTYVYLLQEHGLDSARAASLYAVDHVMDMAFFSTALPLALIVFAMGGRLSNPLWFALAILGPVVGGVMIVILLLRHYRLLMQQMGYVLGLLQVSQYRRRRLARWIIQFRRAVGLLFNMSRARLALLYLYCAGHWLLRYSVLPVVLLGLGSTIPWSYLFLVQGALLFAGQLSMLPGGAGAVEVGFAALLAPWLPPDTLALSLIMWRFVTFYWYLLFGAPVFTLTTGRATRRLLDANDSGIG